MFSIAVVEPGRVELVEIPEPQPGPYEAVIKTAGSICIYGVIDQSTITIDKHRGPYNLYLYIHKWPTRNREAAAQEPICEWINAKQLDCRDFITAEFQIKDIAGALAHAASGEALKILLKY
jgi:hypothetical protein